MQLTFGNMTLELNIFHLSKKHMQPVEDDYEEICVIDTILEEQANERKVQDVLTQELSECLIEHQDPRIMRLVHGCWKRKVEVLPLLIGEKKKRNLNSWISSPCLWN